MQLLRVPIEYATEKNNIMRVVSDWLQPKDVRMQKVRVNKRFT